MNDILDEVNELIQEEDLEGALELINQALPTCYNPSELLSQKAWILNRLDEYDEAYKILEKLHHEGLDSIWFWSEYGYTLRHLEYYDRALDALYYAYDHGRDDAFIALELAQVYVGMEYYEEAKEFYLHALEFTGDDVWIYLMLSDVLCQLKEYQEAYNTLKKVYELEAYSPDLFAQLGWVCNRLERYEEATRYILQLKGEEFNDWAKIEISFSYNRLEKSDLALKLLETVKETNLQGFEYELALAKFNTGDFEGAKEFYLRQPRNDYVVDMLVTISLEQKNYAEAISYLNEFLNENPTYYEALEAIAYIKRHYENDYIGALDVFEQLLDQDIHNEFIYINIVEILLILEQYQEALTFIQDQQANIEDQYTLHYLYSEIYAGLNEYQQAYEHVLKAKEIKSTIPVLGQEAQLLRFLERYDEALDLLNQIQDEVSEVWLCNEKASIYAAQDLLSEAENWYLKALSIQPDNFFAMLRLGALYYTNKAYDQALKYLLEVYKRRQDILWVIVDLACIYETKKRYDLSLKFYKEALKINPQDQRIKEQCTRMERKLSRKKRGE